MSRMRSTLPSLFHSQEKSHERLRNSQFEVHDREVLETARSIIRGLSPRLWAQAGSMPFEKTKNGAVSSV